MHIHRTFTFALAASCVLLSACDGRRFDQGPVRTESRDVGTFDAIEMDGDGRLQIDVGSPASVTVEGKESVVTALKTEVRGNTLHISSKRKDWMFFGGTQRLKLRITVPHLASLTLDGGNDVRLTGFNGGESNIKVQGAAHVEADGNLKGLTIYMAGAGHADFSKLVANDAKVTVDGVGSVFVNSRNSLNATMNGVGAILYTGNPHVVNTSMNGLGRISQRNSKDLERRERNEGEGPNERGPVDPESLQPEYEKDKNKNGRKGSEKEAPGGVTEVI
jgi:hypothetical protein